MKFIRTKTVNKILPLQNRIQIIQGASSAGKNIAILAKLIDRAEMHKGLKIRVMCRTTPVLEEGPMQDFKDIMQAENVNKWDSQRWGIQAKKYSFASGSFIKFGALDDDKKAKGPRYDITYMNEANSFNKDMAKMMLIRTKREFILDFNPSEYFWAHDWMKRDDAAFLKLMYLDNDWIFTKDGSSTLQELMQMKADREISDWHENIWQVYGLGEIGSNLGACIKNATKVVSIPAGAGLVHSSLDFGWTDVNACTSMYYLDGQYYFKEVMYEGNLTNQEIATKLLERGMRGKVYCDSQEPKSIKELRQAGIDAHPTNKKEIEYGLQLINQHGLNYVGENIEKEIHSYHRNEKGILKGLDHLMDTVRYNFVEQFNPVEVFNRRPSSVLRARQRDTFN